MRRIDILELKKLEPGLDCAGISSEILSEDEYIVDPWLLSKIEFIFCLRFSFIYIVDFLVSSRLNQT